MVAGGGGAAKTGVHNRIDIYQVSKLSHRLLLRFTGVQVEPSTDDAGASHACPLQFVRVMSFDTADSASMNMAVSGARLLAAGQNDSCSVYSCVFLPPCHVIFLFKNQVITIGRLYA
jgi:hypothetical protein